MASGSVLDTLFSMQECSLNAAQAAPVAETEWILFCSSPIHGLGGFARKAIPKGQVVIEYTGEIISKAESLKRCEANNQFIFTLNDQEDLDGNLDTNPARWLNHGCAPNCEAELRDNRIYIVATRDIACGEEITFNYGYDLTEYKEYPCHCGAPECVGFIVAEEFHGHVRRQQRLKADTSNPG